MSTQQRQRMNGGGKTTIVNRNIKRSNNRVIVKTPKGAEFVRRNEANARQAKDMKFFTGTSQTLVETPNRNTMRKIQANTASARRDAPQQLVSTYLTFAYEMRPGLERKIFKKYLLLIMHSIDKIAGSSRNSERYSQLYEEAENLTGTVNLSVQNKAAEIITSILGNISKIDSSTSKKLTSLLIF
jgi:hypothetical protein